MPRPSKTEQEQGFFRDYWTEVRTIEADYHGMVSMAVNATGRPGVMVFRMVFTPLIGQVENGLGSSAVEFTYPNVEQTTLAAFLWRKAMALHRIVADAHNSNSGHGSKGR